MKSHDRVRNDTEIYEPRNFRYFIESYNDIWVTFNWVKYITVDICVVILLSSRYYNVIS